MHNIIHYLLGHIQLPCNNKNLPKKWMYMYIVTVVLQRFLWAVITNSIRSFARRTTVTVGGQEWCLCRKWPVWYRFNKIITNTVPHTHRYRSIEFRAALQLPSRQNTKLQQCMYNSTINNSHIIYPSAPTRLMWRHQHPTSPRNWIVVHFVMMMTAVWQYTETYW